MRTVLVGCKCRKVLVMGIHSMGIGVYGRPMSNLSLDVKILMPREFFLANLFFFCVITKLTLAKVEIMHGNLKIDQC